MNSSQLNADSISYQMAIFAFYTGWQCEIGTQCSTARQNNRFFSSTQSFQFCADHEQNVESRAKQPTSKQKNGAYGVCNRCNFVFGVTGYYSCCWCCQKFRLSLSDADNDEVLREYFQQKR